MSRVSKSILSLGELMSIRLIGTRRQNLSISITHRHNRAQRIHMVILDNMAN